MRGRGASANEERATVVTESGHDTINRLLTETETRDLGGVIEYAFALQSHEVLFTAIHLIHGEISRGNKDLIPQLVNTHIVPILAESLKIFTEEYQGLVWETITSITSDNMKFSHELIMESSFLDSARIELRLGHFQPYIIATLANCSVSKCARDKILTVFPLQDIAQGLLHPDVCSSLPILLMNLAKFKFDDREQLHIIVRILSKIVTNAILQGPLIIPVLWSLHYVLFNNESIEKDWISKKLLHRISLQNSEDVTVFCILVGDFVQHNLSEHFAEFDFNILYDWITHEDDTVTRAILRCFRTLPGFQLDFARLEVALETGSFITKTELARLIVDSYVSEYLPDEHFQACLVHLLEVCDSEVATDLTQILLMYPKNGLPLPDIDFEMLDDSITEKLSDFILEESA